MIAEKYWEETLLPYVMKLPYNEVPAGDVARVTCAVFKLGVENETDLKKRITGLKNLFQDGLKSYDKLMEQEYKVPVPAKPAKMEGMHVVLGCVHVPGHHKLLVEQALPKFLKAHEGKIVGFHLAGDFLDLNSLSEHDKGKFQPVEGLTLGDEYAQGNRILNMFDKVLGKEVVKTWVRGNHEDRYSRYVNDIDNSKLALPSPEDALGLEKRGYSVKTRWKEDSHAIGDTNVQHGFYCTDWSSKQHAVKAQENAVYPHTHRFNMFVTQKIKVYNCGFLGDMAHPMFNYAPRAMKLQWVNSFSVIHVRKGIAHVQMVECTNEGFYYGAEFYGK